MNLTITIEMDNDAFAGGRRADEVSRILDDIRDGIEGDGIKLGYSWPVRDSNGNTVGKAEVTS